MLEKKNDGRMSVEIISIEERIPQNHLLRKIDSALDFTYIYELAKDLYSSNQGRKSVDPVVLFKIVFIQHLYGIPSLRRTLQEIDMNMAYRRFLGYSLNEKIPHFATVSYNFKHRFTEDLIEKVFRWILYEAHSAGYLEPEVVFVDSTHIRANANINKKCKRAIPEAARRYEEELMKEINEDREKHDKKPFDDNDKQNGSSSEVKEKIKTESTTDPESGMFHKGEHKRCFAYSAHTVCDRHNYILGVEITAGNVHDSVAFDDIYNHAVKEFPQIKTVTADAGYKTPWICKKIIDDGRIPSMPYKRPMTRKDGHKWYEYVYDEYNDCVICPEYRVLPYATTNRDGYQEFKSKPYQCKNCPTISMCTDSKSFQKTVTRHIWQDYMETVEDIRHSPHGKKTYGLRSQTIERVFADAKEKHGMRYTFYRGLAQVSKWVRLKFAAMNLKKLALWRFSFSCIFSFFSLFTIKTVFFMNEKHRFLTRRNGAKAPFLRYEGNEFPRNERSLRR